MRATASGALQSKLQSSGAERHRGLPWGGGWPERLFESQLFNLTPGCKPSTEKVRPCAHPPRAAPPLGAKAARCRASRLVQPQARPRSPHGGPELRPAKAAISRYARATSAGVSRETTLPQQSLSARLFPHSRLEETGGPSPPPATGPQHSLRSFAPAQATDRRIAPPNSHCPRALAIHSISPSAK